MKNKADSTTEEFSSSFPSTLSEQEAKDCLILMQQGDEKAKEKLILHNMRLVVHVARKFYTRNENEDLISIGYFGLVKGLESFDISKNFKLSTYLGKCIENEILMYLRKIKKYEKCVSLEANLNKDKERDELKLLDTLADKSNENFTQEVNSVFNKEQLARLMPTLSELEKKVITLRFGLIDGITRPQSEIAKILGFSRTYIARLEKDGIAKLKNEMHFSDFENGLH